MDGQNTAEDSTGTSAAGTVSYLARAPQGRQDTLWHVILMLGPRPIADMWRAAEVDAAAELLLAASTDLDPDAAAQLRIQQATDGIRLDLLDDALTEYEKRLQALAATKKGGGT